MVETNHHLASHRPPDGLKRCAAGNGLPVGLRPPFSPSPAAHSHPDCRWILTLIAAAHRRAEMNPEHAGLDDLLK
jgi:hypothetical protein